MNAGRVADIVFVVLAALCFIWYSEVSEGGVPVYVAFLIALGCYTIGKLSGWFFEDRKPND